MSKPVTALILAAGIGKRLRGLTDIPKSLLPLNGETLLARHTRIWREHGITKVVAVLGYQRELIEAELDKVAADFDIKVVVNEDPVSLGNTHSLWLGLQACDTGSVVVFDADLAYDSEVVGDFFNAGEDGRILIGPGSIDDIECAKALVDKNNMVRMTVDKRAITSQELEKYNFSGEAVGALWFSPTQIIDFEKTCRDFLSVDANKPLNWEHVMNVFLQTQEMKSFMVERGRWIEIDTSEDYDEAKELFAENNVQL